MHIPFLKRFRELISVPSHSRTISAVVILIIAAAIPLTVLVAQQQQETRQQATACTDNQCCNAGYSTLCYFYNPTTNSCQPYAGSDCSNSTPTAAPTASPTPTATSTGVCVDFFTWFNDAFYTQGGHTPGQAYTPQTYYDFLYSKGGAALINTAANQGIFGNNPSNPVGVPNGAYNNITISSTETNSSGGFTYRAWRNGTLVKEQAFTCPDFDAIALNKYYIGNPTGGGTGPVLYGSIPETPSTCGGQIVGSVSTAYLPTEQGIPPDIVCPTSPPPTGDVGVPANLTVSGHVFVDANGNGTQDNGELGYNGTNTVSYTHKFPDGSTGTSNTSTFTLNGADGYYGFLLYTNTGSLRVNLPTGYTATTTNPVSIPNPTQNMTVNFGIEQGNVPVCNAEPLINCTVCDPSTSTQQCQYSTNNGSTNCTVLGWQSYVCTPNPTPTPTSTPNPSGNPTPTPTPIPGHTMLAFTIGLDGVGSTGDNVNPAPLPNWQNITPKNTNRDFFVRIFDKNNIEIKNVMGEIDYDSNTGLFTGTVNLGQNFNSGDYLVKVKSDQQAGRLTRLIPGIQKIVSGQTFQMQKVNLVGGEINGDNQLGIADYNILLSCINDATITNIDNHALCGPANGPYAFYSDIDNNGVIDRFDYNLFLREYAVQSGD